jgi:hypothetical protein
MQKVTSVKKLSKKKQRELNRKNRRGWGEISPVTRVVTNKKRYNRKKARIRDDDDI